MLLTLLAAASFSAAQAPWPEVASSGARRLQFSGIDPGRMTATTTTRGPNAEPPTCDAGNYVDLEKWMCYPCPRGRFGNGFDQGECQKCSPGKYQNEFGKSECRDCYSGTFSWEGRADCTKCGIGKTSASTKNYCVDCPPGTYGDSEGLDKCKKCAAGRVSAAIGATNASACQDCEAGTYSPWEGQEKCSACGEGRYRFDSDPGDTCPECTEDMDIATYPTCAVTEEKKEDVTGEASSGILISVLTIGGVLFMYFGYLFCLRVGNIAEYNKFGQERQETSFLNGTDENPDMIALPSGTYMCSYQRKTCCGCCCRKQDNSAKLCLDFRGSGEVSGKCIDADGEHVMTGSYDLIRRSVRLAILYRWGGIEVSAAFLPENEREQEVVFEGYFVTLVGTEGTVNIRFEPGAGEELPKKPLRRPSLIDAALGSAAEAVLRKSGTQESVARLSQRRSSRKGSDAGVMERRHSRTSSSSSRHSLNSNTSITEWVFKKADEAKAAKEKAKQQAREAKEKDAQAEEDPQQQMDRSPVASEPLGVVDVDAKALEVVDIWEDAPEEAYQKLLENPRSANPSNSHTLPPVQEELPEVPGSKKIGTGYQVAVNGVLRNGAGTLAPKTHADTADNVAMLEWDALEEPQVTVVRQTTDDKGTPCSKKARKKKPTRIGKSAGRDACTVRMSQVG